MGGQQTVLIVEDEKINREILKKILKENYTVIEAENGVEAWDILNKNKEDISAIMLDIIMPVMNGYEFLDQIREAHIEEMPIIVTTGSSDEETEEKVLKAGAWDYVTKPYNAKVLLSRLRNAIARSEISAFEQMKYISEHDRLTGLYNREKMFVETRKMLNNHPRSHFILMRADIDHFALFNTSFGEKAGDDLLKYAAACVKKIAGSQKYCIYGRITADVFCICYKYDEDIDKLEAYIEEMDRIISSYKKDYRLDISVGICLINDHSLGIEDYYFRASVAARKCKACVGTNMAFYDESTAKKIAAEIEITNEMQTALEQRQFVVYFQPKFKLFDENISGSEALVRWKHPTKGIISPGDFIPVFEKNGFISKMDYYVWEETCRILKKWQDAGKTVIPVSVNISRISLYNPELVEQILSLVEKYGISPSLLQLEITESAYMSNPELMESTIEALHKVGFTILMDDFGSGYSSLNTLKRIHVDVVKVDMKFLPVRGETERGEIILSSIIKMIKWLGMQVIVEGVETKQQRDFLEGAGCDIVQGFYYERPIPGDAYESQYMENVTAEDEKTQLVSDDVTEPEFDLSMLLIDNSEDDRKVFLENFKALYHIKMCDNAEEGLAFLRKNMSKIEMVVIDSNMPAMSAHEFMRYCSQNSRLSAIPKIIITDKTRTDKQIEAFRDGAYDCITKPFINEILTARINHIMMINRKNSIFHLIEQEYSKKTELDSTTGLFNKMAFIELGSRIVESLSDEKEALLILDIDDLRKINEDYGYEAGDSVIKSVAFELINAFRKSDLIGRFGSNRFMILMTKLPNEEIARRKAYELLMSISLTVEKQTNISASVCIGITFNKHGDTYDDLFTRASKALKNAKSSGKGKVVADA